MFSKESAGHPHFNCMGLNVSVLAFARRYACASLSLAHPFPAWARNRNFVSERFTGRYHCGGEWPEFQLVASPVMGLLGVEDPDGGIAAVTLSFHSAHGIEYVGYPLKGSYDEKTRFDAGTRAVAARMPSSKYDAVLMVPRGQTLPALTVAAPTFD